MDTIKFYQISKFVFVVVIITRDVVVTVCYAHWSETSVYILMHIAQVFFTLYMSMGIKINLTNTFS